MVWPLLAGPISFGKAVADAVHKLTSRPFARWSIPAQLVAICFLEEVVGDDHLWRQISDRKLVSSDDRHVIHALLDRPGRPVERTPWWAGWQRVRFRIFAV